MKILTARLRDVPDRHHSMQAVFEHSWNLLEPTEQATLSRLAVFQGSFDRRAGEVVAGTSLFPLSTLADKSLMIRVNQDRYKLHELVRQFAEERLRANTGNHTHTLTRHCQHYGALVQAYEEAFESRASTIIEGLKRLDLDYDNILAGWFHAVEQPLIGEIGRYILGISMLFAQRGLFATGMQTLQQALRQMDAHLDHIGIGERLRIMTFCGWFCHTVGDHKLGDKLLREALLLIETWPEIIETECATIGLLLTFGSWNALLSNDIPQARALLQRSLALNHNIGFEFGIWHAQAALGDIELVAGNYQTARQAHFESLQCAQRNEDLSGIICSLSLTAYDCCVLGDGVQAQRLMRELLDMSREFWIADAICMMLVGLALLYECRGELGFALDTIAIVLHHPQCGGLMRMRIELVLARYRERLSSAHVDAMLDEASKGQLSTALLEPDFAIDAAFINRLLFALNELSQDCEQG